VLALRLSFTKKDKNMISKLRFYLIYDACSWNHRLQI
jgi:hypothetical protein